MQGLHSDKDGEEAAAAVADEDMIEHVSSMAILSLQHFFPAHD